ncbi:sigma-70 family RNA polymerase sigma factor [uncultured Psychroserpens sp.]|uniref:RNA polymerase sigma factor n=1 Tax=uncultured Psychroserpens sp. TaxID=255436 RepID=UPI002609C618|nr:sigma-70 family RNA polymerase sigma factor [uncultured Psychroserpens sp.]
MKNDDFIRQFLEGNPKALDHIYTTNFTYVSHYITSRSGSIKDAEDVFHNALLILYVKLKEKKINIQSFDNYLFTVCKNLWKRENSKKKVTNTDVFPLVSEELNLASFYLEHSQWELYKEKFELLSKQCKVILKMIFEKNSYESIVKRFSYSSQTVARQRVFKCKKRLTQLIKEDSRYSNLKL